MLIDCDPGVDDAIALIMAVKSPALEVVGVTTSAGNLPVDRTAENARRVLELIGVRNVPVARGLQGPLSRPLPKDPFSHGHDGLGDTGLPPPRRPLDPRGGPDLIVEAADAHAGDLTLLILGPMTNLAAALDSDPSLPAKVSGVVAIAGAYGLTEYAATRATGDNPVSEWNVYVDPEAARRVFRSGMPITAIGLDVACHDNNELQPVHLQALEASDTPEAAFARGVLRFVGERGFRSYSALIDGLAVAAAIAPELVTTIELAVDVETQGELTRGATVVDRREHFRWDHLPMIRVASDVDFHRYLDLVTELLTDALTSSATTASR